ncbi:MAG: helix-turn-helix transcriptional regulator [Alphaproteobacteria bacterium]|nr:helix-turn-helix transcriptional regulator [Alphaproteobacteria bacterium]MDE2351129.1 helix-turn-helix transcriptional regulator [Alphaproteobacteria bacterium]
MRYGPDIARVAALIGDPGRANMLTALMGGAALTASELALEAGVTKQTASSHLSKLSDAGLVAQQRLGRHSYYRLAGSGVAEAIEALMGIAAKSRRTRTGPKEPALRLARVCYDHLAGDLGVRLLDALIAGHRLASEAGKLRLTRAGQAFMTDFGIDTAMLARGTRPLCRTCLDWSERRSHLAGALGAALLSRFYELRWARHEAESRAVLFSPMGETALRRNFGF